MASHEIFMKQSDGSVSKKIFTAPVGSVIAFPVDTVPDHCLECNGAVVSRTTYPELFAVLGTVYGEGDGTSTFKLPDFRDRFLRGAGGTNGAAIGAAQGCDVQSHLHGLTGINPLCLMGGGLGFTQGATFSPDISGNIGTQAKTDATGNSETRPVNYAVKYCIIYE